ncbi:MAG: 3-phosphoshikimate 1-carboxyvinyltransferase, partial [Boseongicola sp.]
TLIVEGSDISVPNIGLNPTRSGIFETLQEMGADLAYENQREVGGEPVADVRVRYSPDMKGIEVPPERAASMIDEYPILSIVAAFAEGRTSMHGVKELRVKESDRIDAMAVGLRASGTEVDEGEDWWEIHGKGPGGVKGGSTVAARLDHRIAMSFLCLGMATREPVKVDDASPIQTSFPEFEQLMSGLGAQLVRGNQ